MNLQNFMQQHLKKFISLVYKNYQGQVAIFVALIFQIVFILFALMINVGLLIHHKINLQQSTDLAAYYGAMKQAEMLNVVGHVNFQIRQAYKLMTWRYRVLGTFGLEASAAGIALPIQHLAGAPTQYKYNPDSETATCNVSGEQLKPSEIPFMCLAHYGFKEYPSPNSNSETFCKMDCSYLNQGLMQIPDLRTDFSASGISGPNIGNSVGIINDDNSAMQATNEKLKNICKTTGAITLGQLVKFYASYLQDTKNKMLFIKMLMANLSADEVDQLDIEGKKVLDGVSLTFRNNLTEANNTSSIDGKDGNIFQTYNSLAASHGGDCSYPNVTQGTPSESGDAKLFAEVNFRFIQYFITKCQRLGTDTNGSNAFGAGSIYNTSGAIDLDTNLYIQLKDLFGTASADKIKSVFLNNYYSHTIGIEKNPWCPVYYGAKATSKPIIPFLPISKITLHAVSFAKPFGGALGPRAYKEWPSSSNHSNRASEQTDKNLPFQNPDDISFTSLRETRKTILNYSNYVGDNEGLINTKVIAAYHDMLRNRIVAGDGSTLSSSNKTPEPANTSGNLSKPQVWPAYAEWNGIVEDLSATSKYDPLAYDTDNMKNSFMRDIELSVVAPNQFEATYYSIEPDFYNVYVDNKLGAPGVLDNLKKQAGISGTPLFIPKDFGHNNILIGVAKNFSVRNQLEVVQHILRANPNSPPSASTYSFGNQRHSQGISAIASNYFNYIPYLPGSLLTSWTMKDLVSDNFAEVTQDNTKMPFAKCMDEDIHGNGYGAIAGSSNPAGGTDPLPPVPGNCITGGRTGYSVKIVSPTSLFSSEFSVGDITGPILNPPTGFISF